MKQLRADIRRPSPLQTAYVYATLNSTALGNEVLIELKQVEFNIAEIGLEVLG